MMDYDFLFKTFLKEYLTKVKEELPESYRARQLRMGGEMAELVERYETKFLKEPFMNAIKKVIK